MENNSIEYNILKQMEKVGYYIDIVDKNGILTYISSLGIDFENRQPRESVGKHFSDVYNLDENSSFTLRSLVTGECYKNVLTHYVSFSGENKYPVIDVFPLIYNNKIEGSVCISRFYEDHNISIQGIKKIPQLESKVKNQLRKNNTRYTFDDIIHKSEVMDKLIDDAKNISLGPSPIMIVGETGTGKELFAQSIHNHSQVKDKPFIAINCSAIPESLIESTLFGTSKGAYTGAVETKGLFEEASQGSIFLDEINSMSLSMQAKLLRVIQTNTIRRVGSAKEIEVNPRLISATNMDPFICIQNNQLRADLFFRLAAVTIDIPPLRNRKDDISVLAKFFIEKYNSILNKNIQDIDYQVVKKLFQYEWPGNVRELQHIIEHALNIVGNMEVVIQDIHLPHYFNNQFNSEPLEYRKENDANKNTENDDCSEYHIQNFFNKNMKIDDCSENPMQNDSDENMEIGDYKIAKAAAMQKAEREFARKYIGNALKNFHGNVTETAQHLNLARQHLHKLIRDYDISYKK